MQDLLGEIANSGLTTALPEWPVNRLPPRAGRTPCKRHFKSPGASRTTPRTWMPKMVFSRPGDQHAHRR